jgi:streptogramin lyase
MAVAVALPVAPAAFVAPAADAAVPGTNVLYTLDADFDQGVLQDVNHNAPNNNQLQLNRTSVFFPYVNIAASARGTMIRIDVNTGATIGEWFSAPSGRGRDPSRTTVDRLGNTWFSNRAENTDVNGDGNGEGSVTRVGVVVGGTRSNADGTPNPAGDFLAAPFAYNTCVDRNADGLIATSRGLGDIRPWTNAGGVDNDGGVDTAADECLINYSRVSGTNTRTVAVDANNDVWTGGADNDHQKVDGMTGLPVGSNVNFGCGGYGGLIDQAGTLWSARFGANLLRYVPSSGTGTCLDVSHGDYGLGIDPNTGHIWHTTLGGGVVKELDPATGNVLNSYPHGNSVAQGVAVDRNNNVWVAHSIIGPQTTVGHLRTDGTFIGNVTLPGGAGPTGVAVDTNGKIWVANRESNNAMRIDPNAGPIQNGFPVGAVDLTVDLGPGASPYNYSDMTGSVLGEITAPVGTWSVVQDGGTAGQTWGRITWNTEPQGSVPPGTSITVEARASDTEAGLASQPFVPVGNGSLFSLTGRFIEAKATLRASPNGTSPVLSDLRIRTAERSGVFSCQATALNLAGIIVARANPPDVPCVDDHRNLANVNLNAGILTVRANVLDARTDQTPDNLTGSPPAAGDNATSTAQVDSTRVTATLVTIEIGLIRSTATARCVAGPGGLHPEFTGSSTVASLRINGLTVAVGSAPLTIPLLIGSLRLNSTTTTATSVTQQAVVLDTLLTDLVLGEAKANIEGKPNSPNGNPCTVA